MQILKLYSDTHFIPMVYCIQKKLKSHIMLQWELKFPKIQYRNSKPETLHILECLERGIILTLNDLCHGWTFISPYYVNIYNLMSRFIRLRFTSNGLSFQFFTLNTGCFT